MLQPSPFSHAHIRVEVAVIEVGRRTFFGAEIDDLRADKAKFQRLGEGWGRFP